MKRDEGILYNLQGRFVIDNPENISYKEIQEVIKENQIKICTKMDSCQKHNFNFGYKLFELRNNKLYPPKVENPNGEPFPVNIWIKATSAPIVSYTKTGRKHIKAGGYGTHDRNKNSEVSLRPAFHLCESPIAKQFLVEDETIGIKDKMPIELVWCKVLYCTDKNYQSECGSNGMETIPENGYYLFKTNPDPEVPKWILTGNIKILKLLSDKEICEILKKQKLPYYKKELSIEAHFENLIKDSMSFEEFKKKYDKLPSRTKKRLKKISPEYISKRLNAAFIRTL